MWTMATGWLVVPILTGPVPDVAGNPGGPAGAGGAVEWCQTMNVWEAKGHGRTPVGGGCPIASQCDTPAVRDGFIPENPAPHKWVRLHFVILREDDGSNPAATETQVFLQVFRMNQDFEPYGFAFTHTWAYADDTFYRYGGDDFGMKQAFAVDPANVCNVFIRNLGGGYGTFPWDSDALTAQGGIVIGEDYFGYDSSVMTHEMGHNLGLWHTHHGVSEVSPCSACWEQADGQDADTTGDFCSDTPPTPVNWSCTDPGDTDPCSGTPWGETLVESYMSYGSPCWDQFTPQQAGRMNCWFNEVLTGWLGTCPGDVNGDGAVTTVELLGLLMAWNTDDPDYDLHPPGGGDGIVNTQDFLTLLTLFGPCP